MSSPPRGLAGTSASGTATHLTSVDTTYAAPPLNTTARAPSLAASVEDTPDILVGDNQTVRIRTLAGFFKFIEDCLYFPKGQRLCTDDVRRSGVGQPIWFLTGLLGALGALRTYLTPALFGELAAVGSVIGRFIQGYWMGPGILTLAGDIFGRFIPGLQASLTLAGSIAQRFNPGTFLTPDALLTLAGTLAERFVPGLAGALPFSAVMMALYQRGRTLLAMLRLAGAMGTRQIVAGRTVSITGVGVLVRAILRSTMSASVPLAAALQAGHGFFRTLSGSLTLAVAFLAQRTRFLSASLAAAATLRHDTDVLRAGTLRLSGAMQRAVHTALAASMPLVVFFQAGKDYFLNGSLTLAGTLVNFLGHRGDLSGTLTALGALGERQITKVLSSQVVLRVIWRMSRNTDNEAGLLQSLASLLAMYTSTGQSAEGGGSYGTFASQSAQGGGTVTGVATALAATLRLTVSLARAIVHGKTVTLQAVGALAKGLSLAATGFTGTLAVVGALAFQRAHNLAASLTGAGALELFEVGKRLAAALAAAGSLARDIVLDRPAASLEGLGALTKAMELAATSFTATITAVGSLVTTPGRALAATVTAAADLIAQQTGKALAATLTFTAQSTHDIVAARAGTLTPTVLLQRVTSHTIAALVTGSGALSTLLITTGDPELESATGLQLVDSTSGELLYETI